MTPSPIWTPAPARVASSRLARFVEESSPFEFEGDMRALYRDLHRWSIRDPAAFWSAVADFCGLELNEQPEAVVEDYERMSGARWFRGAKLNYAENLLEFGRRDQAVVFVNERGDRRELEIGEIKQQVAAVARALKQAGVVRGDRVAAILPNTPECLIAALATASIGAVWSSCSPDFGRP
ncbi:MAG: acetyl-coenzyme A synthetase N-terminal domain-containing protein, partial [Gammaproteobacteria bacterium]|nr:acetyl-coenzyme A synthetase N-terminal domain-containing protein [Gammaproteobacteria bacterium]